MANKQAEMTQLQEQNPIPSAASMWMREMLDLLGTEYESHTATTFEFNDVVLPKDMEKGLYC
jgi:hypothetical protein